MARFETYQEYQQLVGDEYEEDSPPGEDLLVHVPEGIKGIQLDSDFLLDDSLSAA